MSVWRVFGDENNIEVFRFRVKETAMHTLGGSSPGSFRHEENQSSLHIAYRSHLLSRCSLLS